MDQKAQTLYSSLVGEHGLAVGKERRKILRENMVNLLSKGVNCYSCTGLCCTFVANSMQTDAIQTLELYLFLKENNRWNEELVSELKEVIKNNRLEYEIQTGIGTSFRRTYTCPFYNKGPKGCSIEPESKPYGCLGFNARTPGASEGSDCTSDLELLNRREDQNQDMEQVANSYLKSKLSLNWDRLPMPVALLRLNESLEKEGSYE